MICLISILSPINFGQSDFLALLVIFITGFITGVAGLVINEKNEVLVIQERYLVSLKKPIWKFPGGLADPGVCVCVVVCLRVGVYLRVEWNAQTCK